MFRFYRDGYDDGADAPRLEALDALCELLAARVVNELSDLNTSMREHFAAAGALSDAERARLDQVRAVD